MPDQITLTAKVGPGLTVTTLVLTNVTFFSVDTVQGILQVTCDQNPYGGIYDISAATTFTCTVSARNYTIVIS